MKLQLLLLVYSIFGNLLSSRFSFVASAVMCVDTRTGRHYVPPCEDDVESPPISPEPTKSPTPSPTTSPTTSPTSSPTTTNSTMTPGGNSTKPAESAPSDDDGEDGESSESDGDDGSKDGDDDGGECVSEGGVFGDISGTPLTLYFAYELEVATGTENVNTDVLPVLEQTIVDSILSELFDNDCRRRQRFLSSSIRATTRKLSSVAGISRHPPDNVLDGVQCESPPATHDCMVVSAALTLYGETADDEDGETKKTEVKDGIEERMNEGQYDDAQKDIVKVTFVELANNENGGTANSEGTKTDPQISTTDSSKVRVGVFVAAGLLFAILIGVAYQRRRKHNSSGDDGETELGTAPPNQDVHDLPEQDTDMSDV